MMRAERGTHGAADGGTTQIIDISAATEVNDRQFVNALARGLELLRAFGPEQRLMGNQELANRTGLPKPTVSRLTHTLTRLGYLTHIEHLSKYQLGPGVLSLGYATLLGMGIRRIARPLMQELAQESEALVSLGLRDRLNMVYIEHCRPLTAVTLRLDHGSRIPVETTAMGRALLAALPENERSYLMDHLARRNEDWSKVRDGIERAVTAHKTLGFTTSIGEWQRDVNAVGVALIPPDGSSPLAFNCGGPSFLISRERLFEELGPRLVRLARQVENELLRS